MTLMSRERNPQTASIFVVDDNDLVLSSLQTLFRLETEYRVSGFSDPVLALDAVKRTPVDIVISDYLMPVMNGIDLLREVKRLQPETVRILLTGFADKENAIRAINEVGLYQYLEKPWDNQGLLLVIRHALEERSLRCQLTEKVMALDRLLRDHRQLADLHGTLEHELEMAGRVQQSLLPQKPPDIVGFRFGAYYRPCRLLGGDFYDFRTGKGNVVLLVADVSGHGVQAALTSMLLKATFQEAAESAREPHGFLEKMNGVLHRFLPSGMFVAATFLWLEHGQPVVRLSNAGLPYPFVLRSGERRLDEIPSQGVPLGLFGGEGLIPYDTHEIHLGKRDLLMVASDGLGDIRNRSGEFFQDSQLRPALTELSGRDVDSFLEHLVRSATVFSGGQPLLDDITVVAVTRT